MALALCMAGCGVDVGDNLETSGTLDLRATEGRGGRSLCPAGTRRCWGQRQGAASMSWSPGSGPAWPHSQAYSTTLHPSSVRPSPAPLPPLCWPLWMSPACDPGTQ